MSEKSFPDRSPDELKRGRGRPRLPNALTAAQRAKRYRDKKRAREAADASDHQAQNATASVEAPPIHEELAAENRRLRQALESARIRISDLTGALEFVVNARARNRKISTDQLKGLHTLLALGSPLDDDIPNYKRRR